MKIINAIKKTPDRNGVYQYVEKCRDIDYPESDWVHDPDVDSLSSIDKMYWKWSGVNVIEMTLIEKDSVNQSITQSETIQDIGGISIFQNSGRFYCYGDERWVTPDDDNYGFGYYQFSESGGTSSVPVREWEHQGLLIQPGATLKQFIMSGRSNNTAVLDIKFRLEYRYPTDENRFISGYDNDGEMTNITVYEDNFIYPLNTIVSGPAFTGNTNNMHRRDIALNYTFDRAGFLTLYAKPTLNGNSTRYFMSTYRYDFQI